MTWEYTFRPSSLDEMALYPALRKSLEHFYSSKKFSHLLMHGSPGTGKTTAARILGDRMGGAYEVNCSEDNTKNKILEIARGTTSANFWKEKKLVIMDEFDDVTPSHQNILKKYLEDNFNRAVFIFCTNYKEKISAAILDRCLLLPFDVGKINDKNNFVPSKFSNISKQEWIEELSRVVRLVAAKNNTTIIDGVLDIVAEDNANLISIRRFLRSVNHTNLLMSDS